MVDKEKNMDMGIDRRTFLRGAGATAAGMATMGVLTSCAPKSTTVEEKVSRSSSTEETGVPVWLGEAPEIDDSAVVKELDCELLVCGAGQAGIFAFCAAAEQGADVILIDKQQDEGIMGFRRNFGCLNARKEREAGDLGKVDKAALINDIYRYADGNINTDIIKLWADRSGEAWDWWTDICEKNGVPVIFDYDYCKDLNYRQWPVTIQNDRATLMEVGDNALAFFFIDEAVDKGGRFQSETTLSKLIQADDGSITGAYVQNADGDFVRINTTKGVILCTGGYIKNTDMFEALQPNVAAATTQIHARAFNTGEGIKAALWAGAIKEQATGCMVFDRGAVAPGTPSGGDYLGVDFRFGSQPFLKVNLNGERFSNESVPYEYIIRASTEQNADGQFIMIFDSDWMAKCTQNHCNACARIAQYPDLDNLGLIGFGEDYVKKQMEGMLEGGQLFTADSFGELADSLQIPKATFEATVDRYNELCEKGVDEDFFKESFRMTPLDTPPYYGITIGGQVLCTRDGLMTNDRLQVLDKDWNVIEGLYAAGNDLGGKGTIYPNQVSGIEAGMAGTHGRLAANYALGAE